MKHEILSVFGIFGIVLLWLTAVLALPAAIIISVYMFTH